MITALPLIVGATLTTFVASIQKTVTDIGVSFGTIFLIVGAYRYMAANGNSRQMEQGKAAMATALIGLGVVLGASTLISIITTALGQ